MYYISHKARNNLPSVELQHIWELPFFLKRNWGHSLAFLYTNNEKSEREIKEVISFTIATKRIKYPAINLPKEIKDLYAENYEILMKEIKDDTDGEIYHVLELEEAILWKWLYYPKQSTRSMQSLSNH